MVKKIFVTLITIVLLVMMGAFLLNKVAPNVMAGVSNAAEQQLYKATGISLNFNGDDYAGGANAASSNGDGVVKGTKNNDGTAGDSIDGFSKD